MHLHVRPSEAGTLVDVEAVWACGGRRTRGNADDGSPKRAGDRRMKRGLRTGQGLPGPEMQGHTTKSDQEPRVRPVAFRFGSLGPT